MAKLEKCPGYAQNMLKMLPKISVIYNTLFDCFPILRQWLGDMDIPNPQQRQRWVNNTKKNVSGPKAMRDFGAFTKAGRMVSMLYDGVVVYTPQSCRHNALPSRLILGGLKIEEKNHAGPKALLTLMEALSFWTLMVELILSQGGWY